MMPGKFLANVQRDGLGFTNSSSRVLLPNLLVGCTGQYVGRC